MQNLKNAITLLRIPFSLFLMPIYWFSLSNTPAYNWLDALLIFLVLHLFLYPTSNGYNSYYDKDEGSIGGLKKPPKVTQELYYLVLLFDVLSVMLAFCVSMPFAVLIFIALMISKAYSYDKIRIKKYPILGTATVTVFQGSYTYLMIQIGLGMEMQQLFATNNLLLALFSTLFLCGSYPITQIYQHEEDSKRGDITLSYLLGIWGTFAFCVISFTLALALLSYVYLQTQQLQRLLVFVLFTMPIFAYLLYWMRKVKTDLRFADFEHTMTMSKISSVAFNLAFIIISYV